LSTSAGVRIEDTRGLKIRAVREAHGRSRRRERGTKRSPTRSNNVDVQASRCIDRKVSRIRPVRSADKDRSPSYGASRGGRPYNNLPARRVNEDEPRIPAAVNADADEPTSIGGQGNAILEPNFDTVR
jgi:hypothetical protein